MKITRKQLIRLISEAMEDPRSNLDLSKLSPEEREKLENIKASGDMATYYMLLDAMLDEEDEEGDTYLDTYSNALQIFEEEPLFMNMDLVAEMFQEQGYDDTLINLTDKDIFVTVSLGDGLKIANQEVRKNYRGEDAVMEGSVIEGLDGGDVAFILDDLDALGEKYHGKGAIEAYMMEKALLHAMIYLSNSAIIDWFLAVRFGIIQLDRSSKIATIGEYYQDLGVKSGTGLDSKDSSKKITVKGLEQNGYSLEGM